MIDGDQQKHGAENADERMIPSRRQAKCARRQPKKTSNISAHAEPPESQEAFRVDGIESPRNVLGDDPRFEDRLDDPPCRRPWLKEVAKPTAFEPCHGEMNDDEEADDFQGANRLPLQSRFQATARTPRTHGRRESRQVAGRSATQEPRARHATPPPRRAMLASIHLAAKRGERLRADIPTQRTEGAAASPAPKALRAASPDRSREPSPSRRRERHGESTMVSWPLRWSGGRRTTARSTSQAGQLQARLQPWPSRRRPSPALGRTSLKECTLRLWRSFGSGRALSVSDGNRSVESGSRIVFCLNADR